MIRAVFLDFDGTIFSHFSARIPPSTIEAVRRLRERGILVFLCTGRAIAEFEHFDLSELIVDGKVLSNGQMILDENDNIIYECPIDGELEERIISLFIERRFPMYMITRDDIFLNDLNQTVLDVQASVSSGLPRIKKYEGEKVYMASAFFNCREDIDTIYELEDIAEITWWHAGAVDIVPKGISKARGIDEMLKHCRIPLEESLAIGDGENDVDMLKHCAIGVAMGNAALMTKEAADYVTDDIDEDGLYNALKHFELI